MNDQMDKLVQQEDGKRQEVQSRQRLWQSPIVACQASKASSPGETPLDYPPTRQENKAALGLWQFDHFEADALRCRCLQWLISGVAWVQESDLRALSRHCLHLRCQDGYLAPILRYLPQLGGG